MTTCRDIVTYAMRQNGILPAGDTPDSDELENGMVALKSLYDEMVANGLFGTLADLYETTDYEAGEGQRIFAPAGVTITLPETIYDYGDGIDRAPRDLSVVETVIDGARTVWLFDRTGWVDITALEAGDDAPLATRGAYALAATLATSGAFLSMFGGQASADVQAMASRFRFSLSVKHGSTHDRAAGAYF